MFQLLFAEDERAAREGILECIPWEELGITVISVCKNGREAYEAAKTCQPDILLTDIKMAQMDGLALTQKILELYPDCSVIIISGYTEVEYLKSAIQFHVIDYINKPIELPLLYEKLAQAVKIQREKLESRDMLRNKLSSMLRYPQFDLPEAKRLLVSLFPCYQESSLLQTCYLNVLSPSLERIPDAQLYTLLPAFSSLLAEMRLYYFTDLHRDCITLTILHPDNLLPDLWEKLYEELSIHFPSLRFYLCIGIPALLDDYADTIQSADDALKQLFFCSENDHLVYGHYTAHVSKAFPAAIELQDFSALLQQGDITSAKDFIIEMTSKCIALKFPPIEIAELYNRLFHILYKSTLSLQEPKALINARDLLNEYIFCFLIERQLLSEIDACFSSICNIHQKLNLKEIESYIWDNYSDHTLSLEQVSRHFYMSTSWFCIHFKEAMGQTFIRYLTEFRIQRALEFLTRTNMKINDIAEKTGFNDSNYFSKIFKKEMDITPKEYRKKMKEKKDPCSSGTESFPE